MEDDSNAHGSSLFLLFIRFFFFFGWVDPSDDAI
jgi:hypothetical protein